MANEATQTQAKPSANPTPKALQDISVMHPSKYLSADDLKGRTVTVKIASVSVEMIEMSDGEDKEKTIIRFEKANKDFMGGVTNDYSLAVLLSRRPIDWVGKRVTLMPGITTFGREVRTCIRIAGSPDASPERAKAFDQARARAATVELRKQAKRFVAELKAALLQVDPVKQVDAVAIPKLDPEPEEERKQAAAKKSEDAFGLDGGES